MVILYSRLHGLWHPTTQRAARWRKHGFHIILQDPTEATRSVVFVIAAWADEDMWRAYPSLPSHISLGHVTCFGQWDISKCKEAEAWQALMLWELPFLLLLLQLSHQKKARLVCWRQVAQPKASIICQTGEGDHHRSFWPQSCHVATPEMERRTITLSPAQNDDSQSYELMKCWFFISLKFRSSVLLLNNK